MWNRKELKQKAKVSFKKNYWAAVAVCFLMAVLIGEYGTSMSGIEKYDPRIVHSGGVGSLFSSYSNGGVVEEFLHSYGRLGTVLNHALVSLVDSKSTSDSTILYDILNLVNKIRQNRDIVIWCILILTAFGSLFYKIFVANMLRVGECRFFLESRKYRDTKISKILFLYRHRIFKEPAKIMFFRWLYNGLWYLTIVGGIIKAYEYRMIPYIIAENHEVTRAEAFALSKEMMRGQKWKAFMLDVSFLGWEILSILTFGLVGIFYLNSYMMAADTELYSFLRAKAIEEKYLYYEVLNDLYL